MTLLAAAAFSGFLISFFLLFDFAPELLGFNPSVGAAMAFIWTCLIFFSIGYVTYLSGFTYWARRERMLGKLPLRGRLRPWVLWALVGYSLFGNAVSAVQIDETVGLGRYASLASEPGEATREARAATGSVSSDVAGLKGYWKMFGYSPVISLFLLLALVGAQYEIAGNSALCASGLVFLLYGVANFIRMDRLSILGLSPTLLIVWRYRRHLRPLLGGAFVVLAILAQIQTARRTPVNGIAQDFVLYIQSGVINLEFGMNSLTRHAWGLVGIFSPVVFIGRVFGVDWNLEQYDTMWIWNPAHNGFGYFFIDFGWFSVFVFLALGIGAGKLDLLRQRQICLRDHPGAVGACLMQPVFAYGLLSMIVVPAFGGFEYFLLMFTAGVMSYWMHRSPAKFVMPLAQVQVVEEEPAEDPELPDATPQTT
jgi:hypothetical protein